MNPEQEIDHLNDQAQEVINRDLRQAQELATCALRQSTSGVFASQPYLRGVANGLMTLGLVTMERAEYDQALSFLTEAQALFEKMGDWPKLVDCLSNVGWIHLSFGNIAQAFAVLFQGMDIAQKAGDLEGETKILSSLGAIYDETGDTTRELEAFQRALDLLNNLDAARQRAIILNNMAMCYLRLGRLEEARQNVLEALRITRDAGIYQLESNVMDTLGQVYLALGNCEQAEYWMQQALLQARACGAEAVEIEAIMSWGRMLIKLGQVTAAIQHFREGLQLAEQRDINRMCFKFHHQLALAYEEMGDFNQALDHYKRFHETKHQAINEETQQQIENLTVLHQIKVAQMNVEIMRLKNQALKNELTHRQQMIETIEKEATTDWLTGLANRRHFLTLASYRFNEIQHTGRPLVTLMIDIDLFKRVNDTYGHDVGDQVLVAVSRRIREAVRAHDIICRYGGEEFAAMLPDTTIPEAGLVANRLRQRVALRPILVSGYSIPITISLGVTGVEVGDKSADDALNRADQALYAAKQAGRNCVMICKAGKIYRFQEDAASRLQVKQDRR